MFRSNGTQRQSKSKTQGLCKIRFLDFKLERFFVSKLVSIKLAFIIICGVELLKYKRENRTELKFNLWETEILLKSYQ